MNSLSVEWMKWTGRDLLEFGLLVFAIKLAIAVPVAALMAFLGIKTK